MGFGESLLLKGAGAPAVLDSVPRSYAQYITPTRLFVALLSRRAGAPAVLDSVPRSYAQYITSPRFFVALGMSLIPRLKGDCWPSGNLLPARV